ncbi:MAG: aspartate aminotransferase family protein [Spirochaetia bacterium]|nr:aspartate aminotransferase family protein [Spirochaetia bacterium]
MNSQQVKDLDKKYIGVFKRYDVVFERGHGSTLIDKEGNKYVDFFSGISVNNLGYANRAINAAIIKQLGNYTHLSNCFYSEPQVKLAQALCENSFGARVYFANTGAEANEGAMKFAKKWAMLHKERAYKIITFYNSFHGRTLAALTATGQEKFHKILNPMYPGISYAKFNDLKDVESKITTDTCAIMVEPIQAEGGIYTPAPGFLKGLRELCDRNNILLIFDEVQSGMGRTGKLFAYQKYGVKPDVMTIAKSIGGGLPLAAYIVAEEHADVYAFGDHGTTMGGNPAACAAGLVLFNTVKKPVFLKSVERKGACIMKRLKKIKNPDIEEIRGAGLLIGVQMKKGAQDIVDKALAAGLVINVTGHEVLRIEPPLNISGADIDKGLRILEKLL